MARRVRRRAPVRRRAVRRRTSRKKASANPSQMMKTLGRYGAPIGYGYLRDKAADMVISSRIGQMLPASNLTPSMAMFGTLFLAGKLGLSKTPLLRNVISHGKTIELSNFGRQLSNLQQAGSSSPNTGITVYS